MVIWYEGIQQLGKRENLVAVYDIDRVLLGFFLSSFLPVLCSAGFDVFVFLMVTFSSLLAIASYLQGC